MFPYIGGKNRQAKWIASFLPATMDRYVEVFGGAFWNYVLGDFVAKEVVYNDFNKFMANIFACCKDPDKYLHHLKQLKPQNRQLFDSFKQVILTTGDNFAIPNYDIATMYIYIVTQTFSGIMSEKVKMVDLHGKYDSKYNAFMRKLEKPKIRERLESIEVTNLSFEEVIARYDGGAGTYLYLDPPYWQTEKLYAFHDFGREQHTELAHLLHQAKSRWILSYYNYKELEEWYPPKKYVWRMMDFKKASAAAKGKKQTDATELLIMNYSNVLSI